jgi:glutamyl-tRNA reductase
MDLFLLGTSHVVASAPIRERMHIEASRVREGLERLTGPERPFAEVVLLSTCARYEVYGVASDPDRAVKLLRRLILRETHVGSDHLAAHSYVKTGADAAKHLMRVASGLESAIQGEAQILGQVKDTLGSDPPPPTLGPVLQRLLQSAISTGKRVRSETEIGQGAASLAGAAIQLLESRKGTLSGRSVLVIGAGETGALVTRLLRKTGVGRIMVANRSFEAARDLARCIEGEAFALSDVPELLSRADVVIGAVASPHRMVNADILSKTMERADASPPVFLDLAHPRNFDPDIQEVPGVELIDLQVVHDRVKAVQEARSAQVPLAEAIVEEELETFRTWVRARGAVPVVTAVRRQVLDLAAREAERFSRGLDEAQQDAVQEFARSFARSLLHRPTVALREVDTSTPQGRFFLDQVEVMFRLDQRAS